jgi:hypothetical protein
VFLTAKVNQQTRCAFRFEKPQHTKANIANSRGICSIGRFPPIFSGGRSVLQLFLFYRVAGSEHNDVVSDHS